MTHDQEMRDLLRETAAPLTTLTTADLVLLGRRSERHRRFALTGMAAAGVGLALVGATALVGPHSADNHRATGTPTSSPATPPTQGTADCTVQALTLPSGVTSADAYAIDPSGHQIVGVGWRNKAVLWRDGTPTLLPSVAAQDDTGVMVGGVNARGVVVGSTAPTASSVHAWVYRNGKVTVLPAPRGHARVMAKAVNTAGDIAGLAFDDSDNYVAVVWPANAPGTVKVLTAPPGRYGAAAYGIGDDGTVVGDLEDGGHPFVWDGAGRGRVAAERPGRPGGRIFAISGDWAVGWVSGDTGPNPVAARWNLRTGTMTTFDLTGTARAVAADGTFLASEVPSSNTLLVGPDGTVRQLPNLASPGMIDAVAISADGKTLAGQIRYGGSQPDVPVVWHC